MSAGQYKKSFINVALVSPIVTELLRLVDRKSYQTDNLSEFLGAFLPREKSDEVFDQVKATLPPVPTELLKYIPEVDPFYSFEPQVARMLCFSIAKGKNAFLEGPTGSGKTEAVRQVHARLGRPVIRVNMNGDVTVGSFLGTKEVVAGQGTTFRQGDLPTCMRLGATLLIDEIDYTPPAIAAVLNPVLERGRTLNILEAGLQIEAAKGFLVMATGNTGGKGDMNGMYTGTEVLNTAMLDRFQIKLKVDYLSKKAEKEMLLARFPSMDTALLEKITKMAKEVRESFKRGLIPVTLSTRKVIEMLEMTKEFPLKEVLEAVLLNWLDEDNIAAIQKILENHGLPIK